MDKIIQLDKFDVSSADPQVSKLWRLWYRNFTICLLLLREIQTNLKSFTKTLVLPLLTLSSTVLGLNMLLNY